MHHRLSSVVTTIGLLAPSCTSLYVAGMSYEEFLADLKTQDAVIRTLEIVGEATKQLSSELREQYPTILWKNMAGMRDKLIHDYFGINLDIVWEIVSDELPAVAAEVGQILTGKSE
jgi:uncharacterized protein with HEPN domain